KEGMRRKILGIQSMGGGIFIYKALSGAAQMLLKAKAGTKHIILFADANDSEEPGAYQTLLAECEKAGITVSVIGLGTERDQDAELLKDIARRGKGRIFFTDKPEELPRLFAQERVGGGAQPFRGGAGEGAEQAGVDAAGGRAAAVAIGAGGGRLQPVLPAARGDAGDVGAGRVQGADRGGMAGRGG